MNPASMPELSWKAVDLLASAVAEAGRRAGFPYVAVQSDLGDPLPMTDGEGRAYAESLPWVDSGGDNVNRKTLIGAPAPEARH